MTLDSFKSKFRSDKELWASRLKARGQYYVEEIAEADRKAAARAAAGK